MRILRIVAILSACPSLLLAQDFANPDTAPQPSAAESVSILQERSVSLSDASSSGIQSSTYQILREQGASAEAAVELAARTREQGAAFSKEFARLNPFSDDFPETFAGLLTKYPLAVDDEFAAKLIDRAHRMLEATRREITQPATTPNQARQALETEILNYRKNYSGQDLETDTAYLELKRRLEAIPQSP